ncbi:hypothetical protein DRH29_04870 [candidate division Kazan bacterium]|uniref:Uncharacterized protein n=1 Tax=candidate division Kazan bacterium TaxID=2202143 RepID=A0A420ZBH2_UNCK3|nr:MAG: hypothetical protein DRH29_04870 [candidate division Kazan bacterium]
MPKFFGFFFDKANRPIGTAVKLENGNYALFDKQGEKIAEVDPKTTIKQAIRIILNSELSY